MTEFNFMTIRQTAAAGILPEHRLRAMRSAGTLPGFLSGTRFYVNVDALAQKLRAASEAGGADGGYLHL